jgi:hypothetical protein
MTDNKKFTWLYDALKDIIKSYMDNVMKTLASIVIAIGWIVTSGEARQFLGEQPVFYHRLALTAIVIAGLIHTFASTQFYRQSRRKMQQLKTVNIAPQLYDQYAITFPVFIANLILNLALLGILFAMVVSLR